MSKKAVAYYRVSTRKQGQSGLGLEAQQMAITSHANRRGLKIIDSYTEIETGTSKRNRVEIYRAIEAAKENNATLLIAKLDRLARNVAFTSALMESGVDFVACDMPEANSLTIHIMAALAEYEAKLISDRTKAALQAVKARGKQLGSPNNLTNEARHKGAASNQEQAIDAYRTTLGYAKLLREGGLSFEAIADRLNSEGHKTRTGKQFHAMTVKRILDRVAVMKITFLNR